jgi:hypothetical protein
VVEAEHVRVPVRLKINIMDPCPLVLQTDFSSSSQNSKKITDMARLTSLEDWLTLSEECGTFFTLLTGRGLYNEE